MTSVDDLFRKHTSASNKRKLEPPDAAKAYKSAKLSPNGDVKGQQHIQNGSGEDEDDVAGPELPPDEEDGEEEDEEGRFYGGGVNKDTRKVLNFIDEQEGGEEAEPQRIDSAWLRRLALSFEKKISKNAEQRAKFEDEPQKFMSSEADLDGDIKSLSILAEHPELYTDFAKLGCVNSLVSLLAHENTDITIDAIEVLAELTDEDVEAPQPQWDALVTAMQEADLVNLLVQNFSRLDESSEADRNGVYHCLSLIENLTSQPSISSSLASDTALLDWLLRRIQVKESITTQNKQYAAELLAILTQSSPEASTFLISKDAVDLFLQLLSSYRKRDPLKDSDEEEYAENLFDALTILTDVPSGKEKFIAAEGIELCLLMVKESKFSKARALRLLDHLTNGSMEQSRQACESLVEAAGLKPLFGTFMKATSDKEKDRDATATEHLLGIFTSMLRLLPGSSAPRVRTLAKFMEKDYEKIARLVKLRGEYGARLARVDRAIDEEKENMDDAEREEMADEWLSRRLDAGLFSAQTVDVLLAWLVAEDDGARSRIILLLAERDGSLKDLKVTLQEQLDGMDNADTEEGKDGADMLRTLVEFLN